MNPRVAFQFLRTLALVVGLSLPSSYAGAETLVGTNVDNRVILGFEVDPDALGAWLPEGWDSIPFPRGPLKDSNLLVVLIDRQLQLDPEGKPAFPVNSRHAAFVGLGRETGGDAVRLYVYRIYASDPAPNPYGNSVEADVARKTTSEGPANGSRARTEEWTIAGSDGNRVRISLSFSSGDRSWNPGEAFPHSNVNPDMSRIYRFDQLVDLVMSKAAGKPLQGSLAVTAAGPDLGALFDGSEETVAAMDVPVYVRRVFLP